MIRQLPLDLSFPPAYGRADFIADDSNARALAWIDRWPDWPGPLLVLTAPPGCGKTHLASVWVAKAEAVMSRPTTFIRDAPAAGRIAIDDAEGLAGDHEIEEALFHLYNRNVGQRGAILLTAATPPARWKFATRDLASRLRAAPVAAIELPSDHLLETILVKLCSDRQLTLAPRVMQYLVRRMERSADAARRLVQTLDRLALAEQGPITLERARAALGSEGMET